MHPLDSFVFVHVQVTIIQNHGVTIFGKWNIELLSEFSNTIYSHCKDIIIE